MPADDLAADSQQPRHRPSREDTSRIRRRLALESAVVVGSFGTYGPAVTELLTAVLPPLLEGAPNRVGLLLGRHGEAFVRTLQAGRPALAGRLGFAGTLPEAELAACLAACDLLIQPYPDGVSSRRTSLMAGLAMGSPIVTTEGALTEPLWGEAGVVSLAPVGRPSEFIDAAEALLADAGTAESDLGRRAAALYQSDFALEHTIHALRQPISLPGRLRTEPRAMIPQTLPPPPRRPSASTRRLQIAFVVHDYNRHGGHSRYVAELASRFRRDHDVHVFTNTVDDADAAGIAFHHVPAWRRNALTSVLSFILPATLQVRGRFDVIHAQGLCGLRHNLATAHFCQPAWFHALAREGVQLTWRQRVFQRLVTGLERQALCRPATRRVIAVSERVKADLAELYGRTTGVEVVYHGTDTTTFHPDNRDRFRASVRAAIGVPDDRFLALYVGDMKKGAAAAIRAAAQARGVALLILSGSNAGPFRAIAEQEKVADRVIFHPHSRRVETFFAAADALVFPSVYDSFGLVITEAMAAGLPVVASRAAGAAELIESGKDGLLTDRPWDMDAIAAHLGRLRDDAGLREKLGPRPAQDQAVHLGRGRPADHGRVPRSRRFLMRLGRRPSPAAP